MCIRTHRSSFDVFWLVGAFAFENSYSILTLEIVCNSIHYTAKIAAIAKVTQTNEIEFIAVRFAFDYRTMCICI